ncbi:MAG TPA: hypothetical protein VGV09_08505 [Steroidobacteraceae bacterium]|nr:hypothetical protein [Steroidobacteraceae bacterium]
MLQNFAQYSPQAQFLPPLGLQSPSWPQLNTGPSTPGPWGYSVAQTPLTPNQFGQSPIGVNPAQQIIPMLGQLAQQLSIQSSVIHQLGVALHQLCHQVGAQGIHGSIGSYGAGQPYLGGTPQYGLDGQAFGHQGGQHAFPGAIPGGYPGLVPQAPGWGAGRPQTVQ